MIRTRVIDDADAGLIRLQERDLDVRRVGDKWVGIGANELNRAFGQHGAPAGTYCFSWPKRVVGLRASKAQIEAESAGGLPTKTPFRITAEEGARLTGTLLTEIA